MSQLLSKKLNEESSYHSFLLSTFKRVLNNLNHRYDDITRLDVQDILSSFEYLEKLCFEDTPTIPLSHKMIILEDANKRLLLYIFENYTKGKDNIYKWNLIKDIQRPLNKIIRSEHIFPRELNALENFIYKI